MEVSYRETPAGVPSFAWEVISPSLLVSMASYAFASTVTGDARGAVLPASLILVVMVLWRAHIWDEHGRPVNIVEHRTEYLPEPEPVRPFVTGDTGNQVRIGRWSFTRSEWRRLAHVLLASEKLTREPLRELLHDNGQPLFSNLNSVYPDIRKELRRLQWVDEDDAITLACREAFQQELGISLPEPLS